MPEDLIDAKEAACILGLAHPNTVHAYLRRYPDMPRPVRDLGPRRGKLWSRSEIEQWARTRGKDDRTVRWASADQFLEEIRDRLERGGFSPRLFEECVTDILTPELRSVAVVGGARDGGMDGAVADGRGLPYPLVVTTSRDFVQNLERNLRSYKASGRPGPHIVFVTSRRVTPKQRRKLEETAVSLGFIPAQIYGQEDIALRLHRRPDWCQRLLGLSGEPEPLSPIPPKITGWGPGVSLVARHAYLSWVCTASSDLLLVGPPGSGKTAILARLAEEGVGLFVVADDPARIAQGLRAKDPKVLFVDDAAARIKKLQTLMRLRCELGVEFRIVATGWLRDRDRLATTLDLASSQVRDLERLGRDEIVQVIRATGLKGPDLLVRQIVDQARGLPGLAHTMARLCLRGDVADVVVGDALMRKVGLLLESSLGDKFRYVLAFLALFGDRGASVEELSAVAGMEEHNTQRILENGGHLGVVDEVQGPDNRVRLRVHPVRLRHALVKKVFFGDGPVLDPYRRLEEIGDPANAARTLIGVAAVGGRVDPARLLSYVRRANSDDIWAEYAALGYREAVATLGVVPHVAMQNPWPFLEKATAEALGLLLDRALQHPELALSRSSGQLRAIRDWAVAGDPSQVDVLGRRRKLVKALRSWVSTRDGLTPRHKQLVAEVAAIAMSPLYELCNLDPGEGRTLSVGNYYLSLDQLRELSSLWKNEIWPLLASIRAFNVRAMLQLVGEYVYPPPLDLREELHASVRQVAREILSDLKEAGRGEIGLTATLAPLAKKLDDSWEINGPDESTFSLLYGQPELPNWSASETEREKKIVELAEAWSRRPPAAVASELARLEQAAQEAGTIWRRVGRLAEVLARNCPSPKKEWFEAMVGSRLAPEIVAHFLDSYLSEDASRAWQDVVALIGGERGDLYGWLGVQFALKRSDAPPAAVGLALKRAPLFADGIFTLALKSEISLPILRALIEHEDIRVAAAAAVGAWHAEPKGGVPPELRVSWTQAIMRTAVEDFDDDLWLPGVLSSDSELAFKWLLGRLKSSGVSYMSEHGAPAKALEALSKVQRIELLHSMPNGWEYRPVIAALVGEDPGVYRALLKIPRHSESHLVPLRGMPDDSWRQKAVVALSSGFDPKNVAEAAYTGSWSWWGEQSEMWEKWAQAFARFDEDPDERMKEVAKVGKAVAEYWKGQAEEEERRERVFGRG